MARQAAIWKARGASDDAPFLHIEIADTFWRRFWGLMGQKSIAPAHALLLCPCSSVHTFFMRFFIDVAFVKRQEDGEGWQVVKVARGLRPWTGLGVCTEADAALANMHQMALKRGCILPGKRIDYERMGRLLLDEFRAAKIGRITLEWPEA